MFLQGILTTSLRGINYRQWICLVSCVLIVDGILFHIFSCFGNYECQFVDYLKQTLFVLIALFLLASSKYCLEECYNRKKHEYVEKHKLESIHCSREQKIIFAFEDLLEESVSDILKRYHRRRYSYPLEMSDKLNLILQLFKREADTNSVSGRKGIEYENQSKNIRANNTILKGKSRLEEIKSSDLDDRSVYLHQLMKEMDDAIEPLMVPTNDYVPVPVSDEVPISNTGWLISKNISKENEERKSIKTAASSMEKCLEVCGYGNITISEGMMQDILLALKNHEILSHDHAENNTYKSRKFEKAYKLQYFTDISENCHPKNIEDSSQNADPLPERPIFFSNHQKDSHSVMTQEPTDNILSKRDATIYDAFDYSIKDAYSDGDFSTSLTKGKTQLERQPEISCLSYSNDDRDTFYRPQYFSEGLRRGIILNPSNLEREVQQRVEDHFLPHFLDIEPFTFKYNYKRKSSNISDSPCSENEYQNSQMSFEFPKRTSVALHDDFDLDEPDFFFNQELEKRIDQSSFANEMNHAQSSSRCVLEVTNHDNLNRDMAEDGTKIEDKQDINLQRIINSPTHDAKKKLLTESSNTSSVAEVPSTAQQSIREPKSSSNSSDSASSGESKNFTFDPPSIGIELKDMSRIKMRKKRTLKNRTSLDGLRSISGGIINDIGINFNQIKNEKRQVDLAVFSSKSSTNISNKKAPVRHKSVSHLLSRIRNSFKFLTKSKNERKENETQD